MFLTHSLRAHDNWVWSSRSNHSLPNLRAHDAKSQFTWQVWSTKSSHSLPNQSQCTSDISNTAQQCTWHYIHHQCTWQVWSTNFLDVEGFKDQQGWNPKQVDLCNHCRPDCWSVLSMNSLSRSTIRVGILTMNQCQTAWCRCAWCCADTIACSKDDVLDVPFGDISSICGRKISADSFSIVKNYSETSVAYRCVLTEFFDFCRLQLVKYQFSWLRFWIFNIRRYRGSIRTQSINKLSICFPYMLLPWRNVHIFDCPSWWLTAGVIQWNENKISEHTNWDHNGSQFFENLTDHGCQTETANQCERMIIRLQEALLPSPPATEPTSNRPEVHCFES